MFRYAVIALASLFVAVFSVGCGGGGGSGGGGVVDNCNRSILSKVEGVGVKGLLINSKVDIFAIKDGVETEEPIGSGVTDEKGRYSVPVTSGCDKGIRVEISGQPDSAVAQSFMVCDVADGCLDENANRIPFGAAFRIRANFRLSAIKQTKLNQGSATVNVSSLTNLAAELMDGAQNVDEAAIENANRQVAEYFELEGELTEIAGVDITDFDAIAKADTNAQKAALLSAGVLGAIVKNGEADIGAAMSKVAEDFAKAEGELSEDDDLSLVDVLESTQDIVESIQEDADIEDVAQAIENDKDQAIAVTRPTPSPSPEIVPTPSAIPSPEVTPSPVPTPSPSPLVTPVPDISPTPLPRVMSVGGSVRGLIGSVTLQLFVNAIPVISQTVDANGAYGPFPFPAPGLPADVALSIAVTEQPPGQQCLVSKASALDERGALSFGVSCADLGLDQNTISILQISPASPAQLKLGEKVDISLEYTTDQTDGVRIFARPFTKGLLSAGYSASGANLSPAPGGKVSQSFTFSELSASVDQIRLQMIASDGETIVRELFVAVAFEFTGVAVETISNVVLNPDSPAQLALGEKLNITFDYTTDEPEGVRILARPFTEGSLTPGYVASGSAFNAAPGGSSSQSFSINGAPVAIDQIRFQVFKIDGETLLEEIFVDVDYSVTAALTNEITGVVLRPGSPAQLELGSNVNVAFNYSTDQTDGVRIFARPFTGDAPSPGYSASGAGLSPAPGGQVTQFFTFNESAVVVDRIRFQIFAADGETLLEETFIKVNYAFVAPAANSITDVTLSPNSPASLELGERVNISFNYATNDVEGVRISARPFSNGSLSPGYGASGAGFSPAPGGQLNQFFTLNTVATNVDQIRFQMFASDGETLLLEQFVDVNYRFTAVPENTVSNIIFKPGSPALLNVGDQVDIFFDYTTDQSDGVRIFARPFSGGAPTAGSSASAAGLNPAPEGSSSQFFRINGAAAVVDRVRFQMYAADGVTLLEEAFVNVNFRFDAPFILFNAKLSAETDVDAGTQAEEAIMCDVGSEQLAVTEGIAWCEN